MFDSTISHTQNVLLEDNACVSDILNLLLLGKAQEF